MSALVLLNLLNELRKRDKMRGLSSTLSPFRNELNKFNMTGARMLESNYPQDIKLLNNRILFCHLLRNVKMDAITQSY